MEKIINIEIKKSCVIGIIGDNSVISKLVKDSRDEQVVSINDNIDEDKSVKEVLSNTLDYYNYRIDDKEKHINDSLKMVLLNNHFMNRKIKTLSNGEKVCFLLAKALIVNPKILILDNVNVYLDNKNIKNLIKIIHMLKNRYYKTIIVISHNTSFMHSICDDIYVFKNKKLVYMGDKYSLFTNDEVVSKYKLSYPKVIEFSKLVLKEKKIKMGYRDEINDLLKDIYRYSR